MNLFHLFILMKIICPCFDFLISYNGNYFPAKEKETLLNFYNSYVSTYLYVQIKRRNKNCECSKIMKEYFPKTKKYIINQLFDNFNKIDKNNSKINNLEKDILYLKKDIEIKNIKIKEQEKYNCKLEKDSN